MSKSGEYVVGPRTGSMDISVGNPLLRSARQIVAAEASPRSPHDIKTSTDLKNGGCKVHESGRKGGDRVVPRGVGMGGSRRQNVSFPKFSEIDVAHASMHAHEVSTAPLSGAHLAAHFNMTWSRDD